MNLKKLLGSGYFPKELPPPFETVIFSEKARYIKARWDKFLLQEAMPKTGESNTQAKKRFGEDTTKYNSSQLANYNLAKGIYSRRKLGIPNPKQFLDLSGAIIEHWAILRQTYSLSKYSLSTPVERTAKRSVTTKSKSWNNFKFELIDRSFDKKIELRFDISQFYPSIYTHSIPWAVLGKEKAKECFKIKNTQKTHWQTLLGTDINAKKYQAADFIDTLIRNCNDRQSIGLPIGPDTSFILAEVIANRIDNEIEKRLNGIKHTGLRYYDDYYFYLNSHDEATNVLKIVQQVLYEFQLETNESKVSIKQIPFTYTERWALDLSNFKFKKTDKYELRSFFSVLFKLLDDNKKNTSWIVNYALGRFEFGNVKVKREYWDFFLSLLLQTVLIDPSNIDQIFKIIFSYKPYLTKKSKERICEILEIIINDNLSLNHSFEVSWALWILKSFKIKCSSGTLTNVIKSNDSISKLVCLDLINSKLYIGAKPPLSALASSVSSNDLYTENWLLAYESYQKKWLNYRKPNLLDSNEFMKIMFDFDVTFYNPDNQIEPSFNIVLPPAPTDVAIDEEDLNRLEAIASEALKTPKEDQKNKDEGPKSKY
jgi:hypothetical protein